MRSILILPLFICSTILCGQESNFSLNLRLGAPHEIESNAIQPGLALGATISYDVPITNFRGFSFEAGLSQTKFYSVTEVVSAEDNVRLMDLTTGFKVNMLEANLRLGYYVQYGRLSVNPYAQLNATFAGKAAYLYTVAPARGFRTDVAGDLRQAEELYEQPFNTTVERGDDFEQISIYYPYSIRLGMALKFDLTDAHFIGLEYSIPTTWVGRHAVRGRSNLCAAPSTICSDISPNLTNGGRAKTRYSLASLVVGHRF